MKYRIAGVVVLYNPPFDVILNIKSYLDQIERLYVVDNSVVPDERVVNILKAIPKVVYIKNPSNLGIAVALNVAADEAIRASFPILLTMDQDSAFLQGELNVLLEKLDRTVLDDVGIVSPVHREEERQDDRELLVEVPFVMTSGNLVNLMAYRKVGPFDDSLFIDHVDHEYCFRLRRNGYKVFSFPAVVLKHELGLTKYINMFGMKRIGFVSHSPVRTYYMIRNGLAVARKYKDIFPEFNKENQNLIVKEIIKILFEDHKVQRIKLGYLAFAHYLARRTGELKKS